MTDASPPLKKADRDKLERMGAAFDRIDQLILRLGLQGLQRMSASSATELQALQQTAHNAALHNIAKQIDVLGAHVQRYLDKDPLFDMGDYMQVLNRIWLLNNVTRRRHAAGETPAQLVDIAGVARRSYALQDEPLVLHPLGASGWVSDTDFVGVTVYFHVEGREGVYQASNCKPCMYFGREPRSLMGNPISEYTHHTIHQLSHGAYRFTNAKVSDDLRMSVHKELQITPAPYIGVRAYAHLIVGDFIELVERLRSSELHPVRGSEGAYVVVQPLGIGEVEIDEKAARATMELTDERGAPIQIEVALRKENNFLIDNLEHLYKLSRAPMTRPTAIFGRAWIAGGALKLFPYTAIYDQRMILTPRHRQEVRVNEVHLALESLKGARAERGDP